MRLSEDWKLYVKAGVYGWAVGWAICTLAYFIYC